MLDSLAEAWARSHDGKDIWSNLELTFLDALTKSDMFLRQITSRLIGGRVDTGPDLNGRADHVLTKQAYGIRVMHPTSLLSTRNMYRAEAG